MFLNSPNIVIIQNKAYFNIKHNKAHLKPKTLYSNTLNKLKQTKCNTNILKKADSNPNSFIKTKSNQ